MEKDDPMATRPDMPPPDWPPLFAEWGRIILAKDFDAFHRLLAEDVVLAAADGRTLRGPQGWIQTLHWFYALLGVEGQTTEQWFAEAPGTYGWRWRHAGTASTGVEFDLRGCTITRFDGERVTGIFSYTDTAQLQRIVTG